MSIKSSKTNITEVAGVNNAVNQLQELGKFYCIDDSISKCPTAVYLEDWLALHLKFGSVCQFVFNLEFPGHHVDQLQI